MVANTKTNIKLITEPAFLPNTCYVLGGSLKLKVMSIKKLKYGNVENVTVVEFGKGTVSLVNTQNENYKLLLIKEKEFSPIGEIGEFKSTTDEFEPQIVLAFKNRESFDVFKEFINNIETDFDYENES